VTAEILRMEKYREREPGSKIGSVHRHVLVRFEEAGEGGRSHEVQYDVPWSHYKRLKAMEVPRMVVVYDPQDPKLSAPLEDLPGSYFGILFGFGLVYLGFWIARECWLASKLGPKGHPLPGHHPLRRLILRIDRLLEWSLRPFTRRPRS
jgi:hypothetical protein